MEIQPFELAHVEVVLALSESFWQESRLATVPLDRAKVRGKLEFMVANPRQDHFRGIACSKLNGDPVGFMVGTVQEYFFSSRLVAESNFLYVKPEFRGSPAAVKLLLAFRNWAKARGAVEMCVGVAGGVAVENTGRFLQRMGMRFTGGNYSMWLSDPAKTGAGNPGGVK